MSAYLHSTYLSPTSGADASGRTDLVNRYTAARDGSERLLAALLRYYEKRKATA